MNYRYDTSMLPDTHFLRICLSCWRRLPTNFSRKIQQHRFPTQSPLLCSSQCGRQWARSFSMSTVTMNKDDTKKQEEFDITKNPFFNKYQQKLQHVQEANPEEFEARVSEKKEKMKSKPASTPSKPLPAPAPEARAFKGPTSWPPKNLDDIMKVDLIKDKTAREIEHIWKEYHLSKDCLFAVVKGSDYDVLMQNSSRCPTFIFPLPRGDGYEFYMCQFDRKDVYLTPLSMYQLLKENALPCLTIAHFPELKKDKGIVLMAGEYDDKVLRKQEALNLVRQMTVYYGQTASAELNIVETFNHSPANFNFQDVIEIYKRKKESLEVQHY